MEIFFDLLEQGQSYWLDSLSREMIRGGELATAAMYDWAKNPVLRAKKAAKLANKGKGKKNKDKKKGKGKNKGKKKGKK